VERYGLFGRARQGRLEIVGKIGAEVSLGPLRTLFSPARSKV
jgi:hypothetical protein